MIRALMIRARNVAAKAMRSIANTRNLLIRSDNKLM